IEKTDKYRFYAKTGWVQRVEPHIGWYVGYVELAATVWFFVMNIDIKDNEDAKYRKEITREALKIKGII
ncbi:MAG: class D beta-lactamase, partial [Planctomycetes bacterium]|nr:class D beta-lactamase [Planctomycetota bacterium]